MIDQTVQKKMNEPEDRAIQLSKLKHKEEEPQWPVRWYQAVFHTCNWNTRRRGENAEKPFEEMMDKILLNFTKTINPVMWVVPKSRYKIFLSPQKVPLLTLCNQSPASNPIPWQELLFVPTVLPFPEWHKLTIHFVAFWVWLPSLSTLVLNWWFCTPGDTWQCLDIFSCYNFVWGRALMGRGQGCC